MVPEHEIIVVGAGFSGIGLAIKLREAGIEDFAVLDEADGPGGTWHWNTYPGVGVDIPSFSYQYSFEPRSSWSRVYAPGQELKAYAEHCVDKYRVRRFFRFGVKVASAAFDEHERLWRLDLADGTQLTCRFLINATGALSQPKSPDIPGVESFAGAMIHTARWDHSVELGGKRVAIIGTGASAVQVIPEIAPEVAELVVFQRTPIWCLPKPDAALPAPALWALKRVPGAGRTARAASQAFVEVTFPLAAHFNGVIPLAGAGKRIGKAHLRRQVRDPEVREKLTPRYAVGCKRPSFHNSYLATFNRENVRLETSPIAEITPTSIRTQDGAEHDADVLILATGFKPFEHGSLPFEVYGRDAVSLDDWWDENRYQAYEGVSVPGFPNLFTVFGPYGYNGSSYFTLIENQCRHILRCLERAAHEDVTVVEVRREANDRYFASMLARRGNQVFWQDSCAVANSYYFNQHGDVPLRASPTAEVAWRSARFDLGDYRFSPARPESRVSPPLRRS